MVSLSSISLKLAPLIFKVRLHNQFILAIFHNAQPSVSPPPSPEGFKKRMSKDANSYGNIGDLYRASTSINSQYMKCLVENLLSPAEILKFVKRYERAQAHQISNGALSANCIEIVHPTILGLNKKSLFDSEAQKSWFYPLCRETRSLPDESSLQLRMQQIIADDGTVSTSKISDLSARYLRQSLGLLVTDILKNCILAKYSDIKTENAILVTDIAPKSKKFKSINIESQQMKIRSEHLKHALKSLPFKLPLASFHVKMLEEGF